MNGSDIAAATRGITKKYGGVKRVDDVSVTVKRGEIYGLIGKNGAGKTTLLKMMLGVSSPDSGSVELLGATSPKDLAEKRAKAGALIDHPAFYPSLSAAENLSVYARAVGIRNADIAALLDTAGLSDCGKKKVKHFSLGMKQRLGIAMALIGDPEILFLDEPVNGLDPTGILAVRELLKRLNSERGVTVVVSSHLLGELGKIATAYGVMKEGRLVAEVRGEELLALARPRVRIVAAERERAERVLAAHFSEGTYTMRGNAADIYAPETDLVSIAALMAENGVALLQLGYEEGDLESAFVDMM